MQLPDRPMGVSSHHCLFSAPPSQACVFPTVCEKTNSPLYPISAWKTKQTATHWVLHSYVTNSSAAVEPWTWTAFHSNHPTRLQFVRIQHPPAKEHVMRSHASGDYSAPPTETRRSKWSRGLYFVSWRDRKTKQNMTSCFCPTCDTRPGIFLSHPEGKMWLTWHG